jgi:hypothetical protein
MTKPFFDEDTALAEMLAEGSLFSNSSDYYYEGKKGGHTVVLFVLCNDIFAWGYADAEDLPEDQIEVLYNMWKASPTFGPIKWCCQRRQMKPQPPVQEWMKRAGEWDEEMEKLPANPFEKNEG